MASRKKAAAPEATDYRWPRYPAGPEKHLHALGVVTVNYNVFEIGLEKLLEHYANKEVSEYFFARLNNEERLRALKHFAQLRERDAAIVERIEHLVTYFRACTSNRNILVHSRYSDGTYPEHVLALEKNASGEPSRLLYFQLLLPDLRRVADQIMWGVDFLKAILAYVQDTPANRAARALPKKPKPARSLNPTELGTLPE